MNGSFLKKDRCYVIAEIGGNFTTAEEGIRLVDVAKRSGCDAVKLQSYQAATVASRAAIFEMENTGVVSQLEVFEKYEVSEFIHREVFAYAEEAGLDWFSTPSHQTDVEMLEKLNTRIYKVGSDDATNIPFLKYLARIGKPIILSTGMCTLEEVEEAVSAILGESNHQLSLLHAITNYPAREESVNLAAIGTLRHRFPDLRIGYSDHTLSPVACICAVAMGASIIEKHVTYDKRAEGPDHMLSADEAELTGLVDAIRSFEKMRGTGEKKPAATEMVSRRNNRKSVIAARAMVKGEVFALEALAVKRPGYGIAPKHLHDLIGKRVSAALQPDDVVTWQHVE